MFAKILSNKSVFIFLVLVSIGLRFYAATLPAHPYDIGTYHAWGNIMLEKGPVEFFRSTWSDYLPLPVFFVTAITALTDALDMSFSLVFKLTVSLIELMLIFFIYRGLNHKRRHLVLPLLLLSPALIGDSAWWGQLDTLPALLATLSLVLLLKPHSQNLFTKLIPGLCFGLAVAFKPIMILITPVLIILGFQKKIFWSNLIIATIAFILPAYPVAPKGTLITFLKDKVFEQASTYPFRTINAFNFWNINNPLNLWPPDASTLFGISAHTFGIILFLLFFSFLINSWRKQQFASSHAYLYSSLILLTFYTFTTRMHERHLFFSLPFLALAVLESPKLILSYLLLTVFFFINLAGAFSWVVHDQSWPFSYEVTQLVSWGVTLTTLFLLFFRNLSFNQLKSWIIANKKLVLILAIASFLRLVNLGYPSSYIFDEVYHAFTAREYFHEHIVAWEWWTTPPEGVAYEWTHPPLAKYGMMLGMWMFGENAFGWRFFSAIFGVISIFGLYTLVELITGSRRAALLTATLVTLEGLHLAQSRIAMNDIYMLAFLVWAMVYAFKNNFKVAALLYGLALSSKWSAMYGLIPLATIYLQKHPFTFKSIFEGIRYTLIAVLVYLLVFFPFLSIGHTLEQFVELHRQMWYYHTHLVATHAYQSSPWQWVLSLRPVWYFVDYGKNIANIYVQGNPLILWSGLVALILSIYKLKSFPSLLLTISYLIFTVPWIFSPRIMFFYHYLPSSFFLSGLLAIWLTSLTKKSSWTILTLVTLSFLLLSPVYYGIHMPTHYWDTLFAIFPSWK